ncbi:hypothetical protein SAMN02745163_02264 [Clostridium cavendishii DSM 21758]|uniref:Cell division protein FtsL n=1 Tax=Clostridium cavendishii DSM 21758 TaxID=1121302 RepID=A0A1M6KQ78_9CLOT|nr:cell division protein FtsL [Clostridium cavendishii]SHJ61056.1 hypothetical protein SAMN02745163_02264 [Clostridium cavendishii DSM 21758]
MNKLVLKDYDYVKGNTALQPKKKETNHEVDKQYEKLKKSKLERKNRLKNQRRKTRAEILQIGALIFVLGMIAIWRDTNVYSMRNNLSNTNKQISEVSSDNEALRVEILKASSLGNVKKTSENDLNMVIPTKENIVKVDLTKDNFKKQENKPVKVTNNKSFIMNIKDALLK